VDISQDAVFSGRPHRVESGQVRSRVPCLRAALGRPAIGPGDWSGRKADVPIAIEECR